MLQDYLNSTTLLFEPTNVIDLYLSLKTFPLVIFTGISGSGKTKLAQAFVDYMCLPRHLLTESQQLETDAVGIEEHRYRFVSVRSDWLDNKGLLGYYNPLTDIYHSTPVLELILDALSEPDEPFFLILDEMNLAKAEYYFSDFLSVMESRRTSSLGSSEEKVELHKLGRNVFTKSYSEDEKNEVLAIRDSLPNGVYVHLDPETGQRQYFVPDSIPIPVNLYIIGTVNIDETTYRFSPKVIDRSFVIEMNGSSAAAYLSSLSNRQTQGEVPDSRLQTTLTEFSEEPNADLGSVEMGEHISTFERNYRQLQFTISDFTHQRTFTTQRSESDVFEDLSQHISDLIIGVWEVLADTPFRFSYRTINRILRFVDAGVNLWESSSLEAGTEVVQDLFDSALNLKILPRVHGPRRQLEPILTSLLQFCLRTSDESVPTLEEFSELTSGEIRNRFRFPRAATSIFKVLRQIYETNYGSFI